MAHAQRLLEGQLAPEGAGGGRLSPRRRTGGPRRRPSTARPSPPPAPPWRTPRPLPSTPPRPGGG
eukprot:3699392-Alexandrium_andersonii.AAC.1